MTSRRHILVRPAFIFAVALTLRLATAAIFLYGGCYGAPDDGRETIDSVWRGDKFTEGFEMVSISQSLASGKGFSAPWADAGPTAWLAPVAPSILAADMLVFGLHSRATLIAFIVFNEVCSALTILPAFFAARRIVDGQGADRIAALAAWLCTLSPVAGLAACKLIWYTTLSGLLAALLLWATLAVRDSRNSVSWIGYGLLWGVQLLTHPSFLVWMPVALWWLVWTRWDSKQLKLAALVCSTAVLCCVPWTKRNLAVFHHFVPLRSNFSFELWRNHHDGLPVHPGNDRVEHAAFSSLGEYAYNKEKQREAFAWIGRHPGAFIAKSTEGVMDFWFGLPYPVRRFEHKPWFYKVKFSYIFPILVLSIAGLITVWRNRPEYFWLLASLPVIFPLVYYFTMTGDFHRFSIDPILAVIAAFAMSAWLPIQPRNRNIAPLMVAHPEAATL